MEMLAIELGGASPSDSGAQCTPHWGLPPPHWEKYPEARKLRCFAELAIEFERLSAKMLGGEAFQQSLERRGAGGCPFPSPSISNVKDSLNTC